MKAHNASSGAPLVEVDRRAEMDAYDALPPRWRALIDSLPIPQQVTAAREYRDRLGDAAGYNAIVATYRISFPDWQPPSAEDEPRPPLSARQRRVERRAVGRTR